MASPKPWKSVSESRNQFTKNQSLENYPLTVLLEACPKCGAEATKFCKRTNNSGILLHAPHQERVNVANLGR